MKDGGEGTPRVLGDPGLGLQFHTEDQRNLKRGLHRVCTVLYIQYIHSGLRRRT